MRTERTRGLARLALTAILGAALGGCGSPLGFVYVVAFPSREILAFAIVGNNGALKPLAGSPFGTGPGALELVVSPSGRLVLAGHHGKGGDATIAVYGVEPGSGRLRAAAPLTVPNGAVHRLAVDPGGRFIYASARIGYDPVVLGYRLDERAGTLTPISDPPALARGNGTLCVHPSGRFLYVVAAADIRAYAIDITGTLAEVAGSPVAVGARSGTAVMAPSGRFLYVGTARERKGATSGLAAYAIDDATGALAPVPGSPWLTGTELVPPWLAIAPSERFLYAANTEATMLTVHAIDPATGALSPAPVATRFTGDHPRAFPRWLALDRSGRFLYATALASLIAPSAEGWVLVYRADEATGELKALAPSVHLPGKKPAGLLVLGPQP